MAEVSLDLLQTMMQRVLDMLAAQTHEFGDIKNRLSNIEHGVAALRRDAAIDAEARAHLQHQMDRLTDRMARVERRLEIVDAS